MKRLPNWLPLLSLMILTCCGYLDTHAQSATGYNNILFHQLNTSHGLSDNYIYDMAIDSSGNLWVGTGDGLNMFNGQTITRFFQSEYPQIKSDASYELQCDQDNRIWFVTSDRSGLVIDEERRFHSIALWENGQRKQVRTILYPKASGILVYVHYAHYRICEGVDITKVDSLTFDHMEEVQIEGFDTLDKRNLRQLRQIDDNRFLFVRNDRFFMVNYQTMKVEGIFEIPDMVAFTCWNDSTVLVQNKKTWQILAIDLRDGTKTQLFDNIYDQHRQQITSELSNVYWLNEKELLIATYLQGLFHYDKSTGLLTNHRHIASDPGTLCNNYPNAITSNKLGWVFVGATPSGISYYKRDAVVGQQSVFMDDKGNGYDGAIGNLTTRDNDTYFMGGFEHLIKWQRSINKTEFLCLDDIKCKDPVVGAVYNVAFDQQDRLWVALKQEGVYILDKNQKVIRHIKSTTGTKDVLPHNNIRHILDGQDGYMWLSTDAGICRVNPQTFEVEQFEETPLWKLKSTYCHRSWFSDPDNIWIATSGKGAWNYTLSTGELRIHNKDSGLLSDYIYCINRDLSGNTYIGSDKGLTILMTDSTKMYVTTEDGLHNNLIEALLLDKRGRMWMGNDVGLSCFNIADTTLKIFDERYGLSVYGFRRVAYHQNSDDELVWGTERGIQYFYPDALYDQTITFPVSITRMESRDVVRVFTKSETVRLSPSSNYVTFYFSAVDYSTHLHTFYEYMLEGADEEWTKILDQNSVRYSALDAGEYVFRVRASNDDKAWTEASNTVTIVIGKHFWNQWWFRILAAVGMIYLIRRIIRYYRRRELIHQEELETQSVINYFASRINMFRKVDELLWDVAANCISKLSFEDCVIYMLDTDKMVLVQKAAYGPKMERSASDGRDDFTIRQPIDIPAGQGIVGAVAESGKAQLIRDTTLDVRYIVDDVKRHSELAVPMMIDNRVIGVIDSEHSKRNFFTQKHLNILSTIATLTANQIQRVKAEEEKQQAMIEVLQNKQKVTESRLQSLRLQMNPHFLFNALNSIQQMILANEEMVATRYLSRFSKLLRMILIHSDKEMVTLKEELEILKLYVDLEAVRFKDAFQYEITCEEEIDEDEVKIPTLLIQPFVENAIWHGLMHKEGDRKLTIAFFEKNECLHCVIEDNGIGREKAKEMKLLSGQGKQHVSKGISVSVERLQAMCCTDGEEASMQIIDLRDAAGQGVGTRVEMRLPMQN